MRFLPDVNLQTMTFEARTEDLAVQYLSGDAEQVEQIHEKILRDLSLLPMDLPEISTQAEYIAWVNSAGFWEHLDYQRILNIQIIFTPLMRFKIHQKLDIIHLNLPDQIATRYWISYGPAGEGVFVETYRQQAEAFIRELAEQHPALRKLSRDEPLTEEEIQNVADALNRPDLFITEDNLRQAYDQPDANLIEFLRHILKVSELPEREQMIKDAFTKFLAEHPKFRASQIQFLRVIESAVLSRNRITTEGLLMPPFSRVGQADRLFSHSELEEILGFANQFATLI